MPQKMVTLVHNKLKDANGKPRERVCPEREARVLERGGRGWKRKAEPKGSSGGQSGDNS